MEWAIRLDEGDKQTPIIASPRIASPYMVTRKIGPSPTKSIDEQRRQVRRAALKHLALVVRRDKQHLAKLVLEGGDEVDPVVSRLLTGLLELSTGKHKHEKYIDTVLDGVAVFLVPKGFSSFRCS